MSFDFPLMQKQRFSSLLHAAGQKCMALHQYPYEGRDIRDPLISIFSSSHLHILTTFTSSHLHIFSSAHPHIFSSSHLHIFTFSHLQIFSSSHLLIFTSYLLIFTSYLLTFTSHLHILTSSHLFIFTSSHSLLSSCSLPLLLSPSFYKGGPRLRFPKITSIFRCQKRTQDQPLHLVNLSLSVLVMKELP